jgi:tocopherol O-methyltransferase
MFYEYVHDWIAAAAQDQLVDELIAHAKLPACPKVLDVGCGVGGTSIRLASKLKANVTGVTISTKQVEMANENAHKAGISSVTFIEGDGEKLDVVLGAGADGTFDAVWISEALSHFTNKGAFLAHAHRLLKPGGKLVIADWFRADHISEKLVDTVVTPIEKGMLRT